MYFTMPSKKIIVVNNGSLASNRARRNLGEKQYSLWGGGVTTVMSPSEDTSGDIILAELQCVPSVVGAGVMNVNKVKIAGICMLMKEAILMLQSFQKKEVGLVKIPPRRRPVKKTRLFFLSQVLNVMSTIFSFLGDIKVALLLEMIEL